ncbi:tetratricopeptide repeat protein [Zavarzinella formosa]|uniref:tetratricopeptide repeat protein n=1 Tax=Zavarzinella formosa TaxID=360055 RepID=UPI00138B01AA|nr:tetratricopeptide repeat protein [Zavarzinella formosa]
MRSLSVFGFLMFGVSVSSAGSPEWEKNVRAGANYPSGQAMFAVATNRTGGFAISGDVPKPEDKPKLETLLKEFRDTPEDFLKIPLIIEAMEAAGQNDKAIEFGRKATQHGPAYLKAHPEDLRSMSWVGLMFSQQGKYPEAEHWLELATQNAPKEARAWHDLGTYHLNRALKILTGLETIEFDDPTECMVKLSPAQRQSVRRQLVWNEVYGKPQAGDFMATAADCFDWAILHSPNSVTARVFRCNWQQTLIMLKAEESDPETQQRFGDILKTRNIMRASRTTADARRAAELSDDPLAIGYLAMVELMKAPELIEGALEPRQTPVQEVFRKIQPRLDQFRQSTNPETARNATRVQVMLEYMVFHDYKAAEKTLLTMKPDADDTVQDYLAMLVYSGLDSWTGMIDLMKRKLALRDDDHRSFILGKALIRVKQFDEAKKILREAVRKNPKDVRLAITLVALLIQQGNAAETQEADALLTKVEAEFDKHLKDAIAAVKWDEKAPGLPPMKDRSELCVGYLPEHEQDFLRLARANRVLLMGLAGKRSDVFDLLEKWQAFSRRDYQPVLNAYRLTGPEQPGGGLPFGPSTGLAPSYLNATPAAAAPLGSEPFPAVAPR